MEQGLQIFNHPQFGEIRAVLIDGEPWFFATDVCTGLGISNATNAMKRLDDDEVALYSVKGLSRGNEAGNFVSEHGLYHLILGSRKKEAREFKRWVTHEVLPSIRKHGVYMTPEVKNQILNNPDFLISLANKIKEEQARNLVLREQNESLRAENDSMRPKAMFADAVAASDTDILIGDLAKLLRQNGVNVGQNRLFRILRERDFLCGRRGDMWNMPTQKALDLGLFRVSESTVSKADGSVFVTRTTKVTGKGQTYFVDRFLSGKIPV